MQVTVDEVGPLTRKLTVVLPQEFVAPKLDAAYQTIKSGKAIKGFRKGKVPRKVLEKNFGEQVEYDVAEKIIQETYFDALQEVKLDAVVHPVIKTQNFADDGSFSYEAEVDVRPDFSLQDYKDLLLEMPEIKTTDEEVDNEIASLQKQMAPLKSVDDRAVKEGDVVVITFQGYHNGEAMKQVSGENYSVDVGSGRNGKEFEDNLIGLEKGAETSRTIDFPEGFSNPVLAGKKIEFKITVQDIKERVLAEINDEFAKEVGEEFSTLAELKKHISDEISKNKEEAQQGAITDQIMQKLLEKHEFEVPEKLVVYEAEMMVKEMEQNLKQQGLSLERAGMNKDELAKSYMETAAKRVRGDFIIKKIAEEEKIKVEEEDINIGFERIAKQYGMPVDEVKKYFRNRDDLLPFMNELLNEKVLKMLRDEADIKYVPAEEKAEEATA